MLLKNKVIIVTGAASGLGAAIARGCVDAGAKVMLADRNSAELKRSSRKLPKGRVLALTCDVSDLRQLRELVQATVARWGRIDGLVNNAGVNFVKPFLSTSEREWDHVVNVDLKGVFFLTQYCARQMVSQLPRGGAILQIASVHTQASVAGAGPYDAAKHGVVGFSRAVAVELASKDVRVNILSPGLCATNIWKQMLAAAPSKEACRDYWNANIPAGRLIDPAEIADAAVFLL